MSENHSLPSAARIGTFMARHSLALLVVVALAEALWTITYFALLLWAMLMGGGIGSPASYPIGVLFVLIAATAVSLTLFLPSTALAEWIARHFGLPVLAQIPISAGILALLCLTIIGLGAAVGSETSLKGISIALGLLFLAHLVPLGLYWWAAQSFSLLFELFHRLRSALRV